jgi:signal transduction histidine kinase
MPRILVVEDSPTQAKQLAFLLEDAGFDVVTAGDAESGFECLAEGRFDLVLSDLMLPGDSGFDLCRRMKADANLRQIPVVVHTAQADPVNVLRGLQAGADGFMTKDREPEEIIGRIRRTLDRCLHEKPTDHQPERMRVVFLGQEFDLWARREQLVDVVLCSFEDVVYLNQQYQAIANTLRKLNTQLQGSIESERKAHEALKQAQVQLVQTEKLASLGQMVAGVAHEINNPLAFVINNVAVLQRDLKAIGDLVRMYQEADSGLAAHQPELLARIRDFAEQIDLAYTLENFDKLLVRSRDGLKRIQQIVCDLRIFARLDESDLHAVDLNDGIRSTLHMLGNRADAKQVQLAADLAPLPLVACYPAKMNQVVLNLVANAIDASPAGQTVTVRTCPAANGVEIHIIDHGCGIDPAIRDKIFDPFFTTKPQGQGTGLGLSISHGTVKAHGGRIEVDSVPGQGAHFTVHLPLEPPGAGTRAAP